MAKLRPVSHEDRFTLVEHLTELRSRIIACLAIFVVAFAFTYWQNGPILDIFNEALEESQKTSQKTCAQVGRDSLEQSACFDRAVANALRLTEPAIVNAPTAGLSRAEILQNAQALEALKRVQELAPTGTNRKPVTLGVAEPFFQTLNVAMLAALVIALPLLLYQLYAFLIPAFTHRERKAIVPLLVGVPFLFYAGVAFGYFLALPRAVDFLQNFNDDNFDILVQAKDYYKFVAMLLAGSGVAFQVPVVVIAVSRLGVLTAKQMRQKRGFVLIGSALVAAIITPTPDAVTMLLMMAPLVLLFELSTLVALWLERRNPPGGGIEAWREFAAHRDEDDDEDLEDEDPGDDDPDGPRPSGGSGARTAPVEEDPDAWDDRPHGEDPDPSLLGDPAGPRLATAADPPASTAATDPGRPAEEWLDLADELDSRDPFAGEWDDEDEPVEADGPAREGEAAGGPTVPARVAPDDEPPAPTRVAPEDEATGAKRDAVEDEPRGPERGTPDDA